MEALYDEVWGKKQDLVVQDLLVDILVPQYGIQAGKDLSPEPAVKEPLGHPDLVKTETHQARIIRVCSTVPVGQSVLLVRSEYERLRFKLRWAESKRFSDTGVRQRGAQLDYQVSGQPGCGK